MQAKIQNLFRNLDGKLMVTLECNESAEELQTLMDKDLDVTIETHKKRRSKDANALFWAILGEMSIALHTDKMSLYYLMLRRYGKYTYVTIPHKAVDDFKKMYRDCEVVGEYDDNVCMLCYIGSSTYNQEEFSHLLDGCMDECKEMGIRLRASSEVERLYESWHCRPKA